MSAIKLETEVLRNEEIAKGIHRLTLLAPGIAESARPGQFVMIKARDQAGLSLLRRPFSIHQATADSRIQILFKCVGQGTAFLANRRIGDNLNLVGPLGQGYLLPRQAANICVVGGGMGVAPLFYLVKQLLQGNLEHKALLVFLGAATGSEITTVARDFAALGVTVMTSTDDGSHGHHGLVTDLVRDRLAQDVAWHVYSCGPQPMLKAVAGYCLERGWPCQVSLETLMACGISACLGCTIRRSAQGVARDQRPYLHVCKDGPVFAAGEVAWT
jgi:dihydroorotate dehydrogenase electron transfer subunit